MAPVKWNFHGFLSRLFPGGRKPETPTRDVLVPTDRLLILQCSSLGLDNRMRSTASGGGAKKRVNMCTGTLVLFTNNSSFAKHFDANVPATCITGRIGPGAGLVAIARGPRYRIPAETPAQKLNLPPSCSTRAGSEPVICPNEVAPTLFTVGLFQLARLNALNASAWNCTLMPSL